MTCLSIELLSASGSSWLFFVSSKIFPFLIVPSHWFFALLLWAFFSRNPKRKKRRFAAALIFLFVFSNGFIFNEIKRLYSPEEIRADDLGKTYDYGIVLTGMTYVNRETDVAHFSSGGDRIMQAVDLYAKGHIKKILITGGSSRIFDNEYREASFLRQFLLNLGIPEEDVIAESEARNTYENAVFTAALLKGSTYQNLLLITSASHMPRSAACFRRAGLVFDVFPTDPPYARSDYQLSTFLLPNAGVMSAWSSLLHEWVGFVAYKLKGYA
ncbi:YdcF family protein [bacterium]|nr:YdcF family protein [bacterium]